MTKMSDLAEQKRLLIENVMADTSRTTDDLDLVELRIRQAIRRGGVDDLLGPALEAIRLMVRREKRNQARLSELWREMTSLRWAEK